jgi:outer membrane immunogenic protein
MSKVIGVAIAALVVASPALAQQQDWNWTGFYVGVQGGWEDAAWSGEPQTTAGCGGKTCPSAGYSSPHRNLSASSPSGGVELGYNWQAGPVVFGLEADGSFMNEDAHGLWTTDLYNPWRWHKAYDVDLDSMLTLRGRVGYAIGPVLPYITGGLAWGHVDGKLAVTQTHDPAGVVVDGVSHATMVEDRLGWVLGGGIETQIGNGWSIKAEYLHADLGSANTLFKGLVFDGKTIPPNIPFNTDSYNATLTTNVYRAGINYRF